MSWTVEVQRSAEKELGALPPQIRERIANVLRAMKDDPFPHGVKKLKAREGYRIQVATIGFFFESTVMRESFGSAQSGTAKRFIASYRSAAASFS